VRAKLWARAHSAPSCERPGPAATDPPPPPVFGARRFNQAYSSAMTDQGGLVKLHAAVCKGLSDPKRLMIIDALRYGERTVSDLCLTLELPQANTSQHLATLREKGMVQVRREGQYSYYSLSSPKILQAMDLLREFMNEVFPKPRAPTSQ